MDAEIIKSLTALIDRKKTALERTTDPRTNQAIKSEIILLNKFQSFVEDLSTENEQLKKEAKTANEGKAIAEAILILHGIPDWDIQYYYNKGLEAVLSDLQEKENTHTVVVPILLRTIE